MLKCDFNKVAKQLYLRYIKRYICSQIFVFLLFFVFQ